MAQRITITDLARITGFSKTTISHVVNNTRGARIRPETRELIQKAAREHNYVPNFFARNIIRGKTRYLAFLTHDLDEACRSGELLGVEQACRAGGYHLMIANAGGLDMSESQLVEELVQRGIEGLYADWLQAPLDALERFNQFGVHLALGDLPSGGIDADCVYSQTNQGLKTLADKLRELGHHSLILASTGRAAQSRFRVAAREALTGHGLSVREVQVNGPDRSSPLSWMETGPGAPSATALVFLDGALALGTLAGLLAQGRRVPQDLSLIVAGADADLGYESPKLARLSWPARERGARAVERLIQRAEGATPQDLPHLSLGLTPTFFEGGSLGPPPQRA